MNVQVTSVGRTRQRIADAPAAVYVISQEDIRRSGMTSIPELLRMVPGMDVARANANEWAISARGFNDVFANKLLVLMDGRAVYTPLFAGVYWSQQDYILADLDRIEAIRGPGATLWGANAVNGVINITSKSARDTQGAFLEARYGTDEWIGAARYGGKIDENTYYRVWSKYRSVDDFDFTGGDEAHDGFDAAHGGFRIDRYSGDNTLTLQGDIFSNRIGQTSVAATLAPLAVGFFENTYDESGGNVLGRWTHKDGPDSEFMLQAYVDRFYRAHPNDPVAQNTVDIEFQHSFRLGRSQQLTWGGGYRLVYDSDQPSAMATLTPRHRTAQQMNLYGQDNIALVPERLHLFLGSKFEVNSYSGFEVEPGARILWTPSENHSIWASISHAVRTPSRADEDVTGTYAVTPTPTLPALITATGNVGLDAEKLTAWELGYRFEPVKRFSLDLAAFFNRYDDLIAYSAADPPAFDPSPIPHLIIPFRAQNAMFGETYGFELSGTARVTDALRIVSSYSYFETAIHSHSSLAQVREQDIEGSAPHNQFQVRAYYDVTRDIEVNAAAYYVDTLSSPGIPAYWRVDANLTWHAGKHMDLTVGVQNALDNQHPEWSHVGDINAPTEAPRTVYAQAIWRF